MNFVLGSSLSKGISSQIPRKSGSMASAIAPSPILFDGPGIGAHRKSTYAWAAQAYQRRVGWSSAASVPRPGPLVPLHDAARTGFGRRGVFWSGFAAPGGSLAFAAAACAARIGRSTPRRGKIIACAKSSGEKNPLRHRCGQKITARVKAIMDAGLLLFTADGEKVFIPNLSLQREKGEYSVGEELQATVVRLPVAGTSKDAFKATDRPRKPMKSLQIGNLVDGMIAQTSDTGVLFDIGVPKNGPQEVGKQDVWKGIPPTIEQ